jgi:LysM repeat protein
VVYTIKSGDNLTRIAQQFSTSVDAITSANPGINPSRIFSGQQLVVPVGRPQYRGKGVILKQGETLQTIADRYKLGLEGLVQLNSLASASDVKAGDAVLIP